MGRAFLVLHGVLLGLEAGAERLLEALELLRSALSRLLGLFLGLGARLFLPFLGLVVPGDQAGGRADGGSLAGVVRSDLADQGAGGGASHGSFRAGPLSLLLRLLLGLLGLGLLLLGLLLDLEGIAAGLADRPVVAVSFILVLLLGRLSRGGEDVHPHRRAEALLLPGRRRRGGLRRRHGRQPQAERQGGGRDSLIQAHGFS